MHRRLVYAFALLAASPAYAHVRITSPTPRSTTVLKDRHCGMAGLPRANVHTMRPGSTLHLVWDEYVPHPGWFRISFQQHGDIFEIPPASNGNTGAGAASNYPTEDLTGKTDAKTGSMILADRIPDGTLSKDVVLPDVECDDCTVQLIQMMTDKPPYSEDTASNDIYFACVDLVLSASAPDAGPGNMPGPDAGADADAGTASNNGTGGGCSSSSAPSALFALAAVGLLRRKRRAHRS